MAEVILIAGLVMIGLAAIWSVYLLFQAIIDFRVLKASGRNGPLKALSTTAIVAETIRLIKLALLFALLAISFLPQSDAWLIPRRILILVVIMLIAAGSIYGGIARRALIGLVEDEVFRLKEATYVKATELLPDEVDGEETAYRIEEIAKPAHVKPPPTSTPEAE